MSQPRPRTFASPARRGRRRHARHGERREHAGRAHGAATEQHARENREVGGRAEQTRVPGDAAHAPRRRIVHDPAQHLHVRSVARPAVRRARLRRGDARRERGRRREHRVPHAERREDALAHELGEGLLATRSTISAKQEVVDVAVDEPPARRLRQHFFSGEADRRVLARPRRRPDPRRAAGPDMCVIRSRTVTRSLPYFRELRNERRHRIRQSDAAAPRPASSRRASSRRPWSATRGRRSCRASSAPPPAAPRAGRTPCGTRPRRRGRRHHGARQLAGGNRVVDHAVQRVEPREIDARRLRACGRRWLGAYAESSHRGDQENGNQHGSSHAPIIATGWTGPPPALAAFRR